ncbi:MAG: sigma-70 family RNA polymerase sigma factor [Gammaproteobacteria bacterium]|nr:sigma-70 family RNA polymerase sigma factor [Gammaproteobacteria bacterium]
MTSDMPVNANLDETLIQIVRENSARLLAALVAHCGDLSLAEDVLQEAVLIALKQWRKKGAPQKPAAWIYKTAKNRAIDYLRREQSFTRKTNEVAALYATEVEDSLTLRAKAPGIPDERLKLIFTCCHPALPENARIVLTLKTLCGLSTAQIAKAYLVDETTMAQRLVRAKHKIKATGIPYQIPRQHQLTERVTSVLSVIYLIFNEGYVSSVNQSLMRTELCEEAIYLGKMLLTLLPMNTEAMGLLALMFFHHARNKARISPSGELVSLEHQNRKKWDHSLIEQGDKILKPALMVGDIGPYQLQAAISAVHVHARRYRDTDWKQIVMLYRHLDRLQSTGTNPIVKVNLAMALSFAETPLLGLAYLDAIPRDNRIDQYHPYHLARADILFRLERFDDAKEYCLKAMQYCENKTELSFIKKTIRNIEEKRQK